MNKAEYLLEHAGNSYLGPQIEPQALQGRSSTRQSCRVTGLIHRNSVSSSPTIMVAGSTGQASAQLPCCKSQIEFVRQFPSTYAAIASQNDIKSTRCDDVVLYLLPSTVSLLLLSRFRSVPDPSDRQDGAKLLVSIFSYDERTGLRIYLGNSSI